MLLALVLLVSTVFTYISTLCVVSLAKVTIYMIYIEPLFLHVNFKPTVLIMTVLFNGMTMIGTQLIRLSFVIKLSSRRYFLN